MPKKKIEKTEQKEIKKKQKKEPFIQIKIKKMTKKEKEIQKKVTKLNKVTKILGILFIFYIVFFFINNIIMSFNENYAYFYVNNITNLKTGILFYIFSIIPYANFVIPITFFILVLILSIRTDNTKLDIKKRNKAYNLTILTFIIFLYCFTLSILTDNQYYTHMPNFDKLLFEETKDKTYTEDDLIILNNYLRDKVIENATTMQRDEDGNIILKENLNKLAANDLRNVSNELELLKGLYPIRSNNLNDTLKGLYGSSTVGLTNMYTTYLDYNASPVSSLGTITHEYCHTKGITRENETVFCSFLAGVNSNNKVSNYSAYLEAFSRSNYALSYINPDEAFNIEEDVLRMCLTNNYTELCEMYIKNNTGYIPGVEELWITTYSLKDYINHLDEFTKVLAILDENNATFKINDEEYTKDDVISFINSEYDGIMRIKLDLNSKTYNKIEPAIKNGNLFISIYQKDLDEEEPPEIENPMEFFLSPFKENDEGLFTGMSYAADTYVYERASRLFLEYYDKNGYN